MDGKAHSHSYTHRLFDEETENALREIFNKFQREVLDYLVVSKNNPDECPTCGEAEHLATELNRISNGKLKIEIIDKNDDIASKLIIRYTPAFIYGSKRRNIRYYGLPSGQEFAPFIYIHQYIANNEIKLSNETIEIIEAIENPLHIKIFVTPECPYCPLVVDSFNQMGLVNDLLLVETIEAVELPHEADMYGVMYVPYVVLTDPARQKEYGVEPIEVINGYLPPEEMAKVIYNTSKKIKRIG
ncbi:MAG: glutaredoxin [Desulfurococcales archaeon ex4484_58]|nr:MAG: glutaredoxin [Desulfurococcales archaeon ex4484_58]